MNILEQKIGAEKLCQRITNKLKDERKTIKNEGEFHKKAFVDMLDFFCYLVVREMIDLHKEFDKGS
jgi:hypothetical protein